MSSQQANTNTGDHKLKLIVFKACHVAVWADSKMTADERRCLSHLTEVLCKTQAERKVFREIRLQEINEDLLLSEIEPLSKEEKAYVFDACLETLASDRKINLLELNFLATLRKVCGIRHWSYQKKLARVCQKTKARIYPTKPILSIAFLSFILIFVIIYIQYRPESIDINLQEACSGGPLIDQYGSLCAIVTKGHETKDYGFALYSDVILEVLEERKELKIDTLLE